MQREPGKRDYGSSDCARLRSLASRGVLVTETAPKPAPTLGTPARDAREHRVRPRPERHARA
ncbi:MAG TPA: hypothetical protein VM621_19205 [Luteibacter sp.]|uniref:hypothetical protein n=1 Tax=Luteibacter sp. TaxID=1886636 RepID=UPI002C2C6B2A|nr:hypothetical protein [Luteibacter sp.]HVI57177.1 hypothetical protein [Luteibacter sp.]